jgi:hypothetical protein
LRGEVLRAWNALSRLPLDRAAVSIRTRAILTGSANTPPSRGTVLAEQVGWELPASAGGPDAVADAAKRFVAGFPALGLALVVLSVNLLGDVWRDMLDPSLAPSAGGVAR